MVTVLSKRIAIEPGLIDPYGIVKDTVTNEPIASIQIKLYWADTELNRDKGRTKDTLVPLPTLSGFDPNQNKNPQNTTVNGEYAWMVFADGDYYLLGTKDGYTPYDSRVEGRDVPVMPGEDSWIENGIIHVGESIVEYDFDMSLIRQTGTDFLTYSVPNQVGNALLYITFYKYFATDLAVCNYRLSLSA